MSNCDNCDKLKKSIGLLHAKINRLENTPFSQRLFDLTHNHGLPAINILVGRHERMQDQISNVGIEIDQLRSSMMYLRIENTRLRLENEELKNLKNNS